MPGVTNQHSRMVAHSLGSVVAYEALCASPGHGVKALVALGSPLAIANLVVDRLDPASVDEMGVWPGLSAKILVDASQ